MSTCWIASTDNPPLQQTLDCLIRLRIEASKLDKFGFSEFWLGDKAVESARGEENVNG